MPIPTTDIGKRLMRWQLAHTAPAPLSIDHPVQVDLAAAADEIERLTGMVTKECARQVEFGNILLPVAAQQNVWEFCYDIATHAQSLEEPMRRVFFQRAKDIAILLEGVSDANMPRGLQSAFKWKCETVYETDLT